jgi:hypothetical protein
MPRITGLWCGNLNAAYPNRFPRPGRKPWCRHSKDFCYKWHWCFLRGKNVCSMDDSGLNPEWLGRFGWGLLRSYVGHWLRVGGEFMPCPGIYLKTRDNITKLHSVRPENARHTSFCKLDRLLQATPPSLLISCQLWLSPLASLVSLRPAQAPRKLPMAENPRTEWFRFETLGLCFTASKPSSRLQKLAG